MNILPNTSRKRDIKRTKLCVFPIPANVYFNGPYAEELYRLSFYLMQKTASTDERKFRGFFIPLSRDWFRDKFGGNYSAVKRAAAEREDVFCFNRRYSNRFHFCQSIRLTARHRTGEFRHHESPKPIRNPHSFDTSVPMDQTLFSMFPSFRLPDNLEYENYWQAYQAMTVNNGFWYASRCDYNRFHSNFTSLKHRHFLRSESPLSSIDVANCQPLILGIVSRIEIGSTPDVEKWLELCRDGSLYEWAMEQLGVADRKEAKFGFIKAMFDRNHKMLTDRYFLLIKSNFPRIAEVMKEIKSYHYTHLAHRMQRTESKLMIDGVAGRLIRDYPGIPLVTCHDEIMLPTSHVRFAQREIEKTFKRRGVIPATKIEANFSQNSSPISR